MRATVPLWRASIKLALSTVTIRVLVPGNGWSSLIILPSVLPPVSSAPASSV